MSGYEEAKAVNDKLKAEKAEREAKELQAQDDAKNDISVLYGRKIAKLGREEMGSEDFNIPYLILLQTGTDIPELRGKSKTGYYYRSDTAEQIEKPLVTFVYVTNEERYNDKKKLTLKNKAYFGFYQNTQEPFKLRMSGFGFAAHKQLQTELSMYENRYEVPMFALTVELSSENKSGVTKDGEKYNVEKIVCSIVKNEDGTPNIELDPARIGFLAESIDRFKQVAPSSGEERPF